MGEGTDAVLSKLDRDFWISKYPVTQAQFAGFVNAGGYKTEAFWPEAEEAKIWKPGRVKGSWDAEFRQAPAQYGEPFTLPNHPVVGVTWYEALAFARWLDKQLKNKKLSAAGLRVALLTEQQWEKAARGGEKTPAEPVVMPLASISARKKKPKMVENPHPKRSYPWQGEADANKANYNETRINAANAVGCFSNGASPYGCEEMGGNVWEWCLTKYDKPDDNSTRGGDVRVVRGGSYIDLHYNVRCSYRYRDLPGNQNDVVGFRVALSISDL